MLAVVSLALLGSVLSATIDPSLAKWKLLKLNGERVRIPLSQYNLEVKAFRPDVYDTNPSSKVLFRTDKPTSMMVVLYAGSWENRVGRLLWHTIKYDKGYDVKIEECDVIPQPYRTFPADGDKDQIWSWSFNQDNVELTCDGELQYLQDFDEGEVSSWKTGLPQKCRALGDAEVDRISFRNMEGYYIRAVPKDGVKFPDPEPEEEIPEEIQLDDPAQLIDPSQPQVYPTCSCWTQECGYCSNLECTVKQDLSTSSHGISVTVHHNKATRKKLHSIILYDEPGNVLGTFQWNLKNINLSGCISCPTPVAKMKNITQGAADAHWTFHLENGMVRIYMKEEVMYERALVGKCVERYGKAKRFAFNKMGCENSFKFLASEMEAGANVTPDCGGTCPMG